LPAFERGFPRINPAHYSAASPVEALKYCVLRRSYTGLGKGWVGHDDSSIHPKVVPPVCGTGNFEG
jgi:hypothetical protein